MRCYRLCLGRDADSEGLNAWCQQILSGQNTAKQVAYGFLFSNEFTSKNLSDEEYVQILYQLFMDRGSDPSGLNSWCGVLANGQTRLHVFNGFADSVEFQEICSSYGIPSGSGIPVGGSGTSSGSSGGSGGNSGSTGGSGDYNPGHTTSSTVYYTASGSKYHSTPNCSSLKRSKHIYSTSIDTAKSYGLTPCRICYH